MQEIDQFASSLLEEAKRFLEKASAGSAGENAETANLHAALMLAACSLEAHVNAVCDEMAKRTKVPHERGILLEREVHLKAGEFKVDSGLKMFRIEDRLEFLHQRFGQKEIGDGWKGSLRTALDLRNKLTHPKAVPQISLASVQRAVEAIIDTIDALYRAVYGKAFPAASLGLDSTLNF